MAQTSCPQTDSSNNTVDPQASHVHFNAEQVDNDHELGIVIKRTDETMQEVHIGFLKLHHHYAIEFDIKDNLGEDIEADPLQNLHCRVVSCPPTEDGEGHTIAVHFNAYKDKLLNESLTLTSLDKTKSLTLKLMARVLGKHKGTPMLKNGIKCVGMDADDDSEQSDWGGFN